MESLAESARLAYIDGWARTAGPLTERVKTGCAIAVNLAVEHPDTPGILEATLQLGSLEGTWALVYARREAVYAKHVAAAVKGWQAIARRLDIRAAVRTYRQTLGLTETVTPDQRVAANQAAVSLVHSAADPNGAEWRKWLALLAVLLAEAEAEGVAGAVGVAADDAGYPGIDFDAVHADALAAATAPGRSDGRRADAVTLALRIVNGATTDVARVLGSLADSGTEADMIAAVQDQLGIGDDSDDDSGDDTAVALYADEAIGQSFTRGILGWLTTAGVRQVDFITAGDNRVCPQCLEAEAGNSYTLGSAPQPPLHPRCRCTIEGADTVPLAAFAAYLLTS